MRAAGCLNGNLRQAVRALQSETYDINIVQYLANIVNYICAKSEKTDARIGHPLQVIRTTRNRQK